jgi:UDP:flavonoid glycosyltransferase YjiC (YdhE family)
MTQGDSQVITVVKELDVYAQRRCRELHAPFGIVPAQGVPANRSPSCFVYLTTRAPATRKVLQALLELGIPFEAFLRDADPKLKNVVRERGGFVHDSPPSIEAMLHRHHAIIHHGGIGTSQTALAAGRPQVLVPRHFEQTLTAARLRALSVGTVLSEKSRPSDVRKVLENLPLSQMQKEANRRAKNIANRSYPDLHRVIVAEASRLVSS